KNARRRYAKPYRGSAPGHPASARETVRQARAACPAHIHRLAWRPPHQTPRRGSRAWSPPLPHIRPAAWRQAASASSSPWQAPYPARPPCRLRLQDARDLPPAIPAPNRYPEYAHPASAREDQARARAAPPHPASDTLLQLHEQPLHQTRSSGSYAAVPSNCIVDRGGHLFRLGQIGDQVPCPLPRDDGKRTTTKPPLHGRPPQLSHGNVSKRKREPAPHRKTPYCEQRPLPHRGAQHTGAHKGMKQKQWHNHPLNDERDPRDDQ